MKLLIRADANVSIGTGHVMRCLALAQACQDDGGCAMFAIGDITPALEKRLQTEDMQVVRLQRPPGTAADAKQTTELAQQCHADWVVVDGYQFGFAYQNVIKESGKKLLFFDDNGHGENYVADVVLNPNIHADEAMYPERASYTTLLLGTQYAILRREFRQYCEWKRKIAPVARKILVTLGGSDPRDLTRFVVEALQELDTENLNVTVVVGGSNPQLQNLQERVASSALQIQLITNSSNMAELMASADFAISAAGSTCWEMCFMGLPALIIDAAPNQRALAERLHELGAAVHLPSENLCARALAQPVEHFNHSPDIRRSLSAKGRGLVDGHGMARVLASLNGEVRLRPTLQSDCRFIWEWANDPQVRAMSFSGEPIPWERHVAWFSSKLADSSAMLYVATDAAGQPVGQVRYELRDQRAAVSLNVGPEFRGKGYGKKMLLLATQELFRRSAICTIDAFVKPCNGPSLRLFEVAGFRRQGMAKVQGQQAVHFILPRTQ